MKATKKNIIKTYEHVIFMVNHREQELVRNFHISERTCQDIRSYLSDYNSLPLNGIMRLVKILDNVSCAIQIQQGVSPVSLAIIWEFV